MVTVRTLGMPSAVMELPPPPPPENMRRSYCTAVQHIDAAVVGGKLVSNQDYGGGAGGTFETWENTRLKQRGKP